MRAATLCCLALLTLGAAALGAPNATILWNSTVANGAVLRNHGGAFASGNILINTHTEVTALDAVTGVRQWSVQLPSGINAGRTYPVVWKDIAYVLSTFVVAVNASSGAIIWNSTMPSGTLCSFPAATVSEEHGLLYVPTLSTMSFQTCGIAAFDLRNGTTVWSSAIVSDCTTTQPPAVTHGTVSIADDKSNVYVLDALTGATRFSKPLPTRFLGKGGPLAAGCGVIVSSMKWMSLSTVAGHNATSGAMLWHVGMEGVVVGSTVLPKDCMVYATDGVEFYAIDAKTGVSPYTTILTLGEAIGATVWPLRGTRAAYVMNTPTGVPVAQVVELTNGTILHSAFVPLALPEGSTWLAANDAETVFFTANEDTVIAFTIPTMV